MTILPNSSAAIMAAVHQLPSVTDRALAALIRHRLFDRPIASWTIRHLIDAGVSVDRARAIIDDLPRVTIERAAAQLIQYQITLLTLDDRQYPPLLREISGPPAVLYIRGRVDALHRPGLAVVGTRQATPYGQRSVRRLVEPVAEAGVTIVSGLARGIDTLAHRAALSHGAPTVAVLGSGLDQIYPWENRQLAVDIIDRGGAVVSEFPLGAAPERHHFPQRNRVISGLVSAVLVIEAGATSGALVTAKFALDQNRELFVVPGPITSAQSVGVNSWLKLGAAPATEADDLLRHFRLSPAPRQLDVPPPAVDDPRMAALLSHLGPEPVHIDELAEKSRLDTSVVTATLALMEIRGLVIHVGGMNYTLAS